MSTAVYRAEVPIRFAHCDPAGMVFYPRYLEIFNNLVEDWCRAARLPFADIHDGRGLALPTVHVEADFPAPSCMGETLSATIAVNRVGASSIALELTLAGSDGSLRVRGALVLVLMDVAEKRAVPIPEEMRERILQSCQSSSPSLSVLPSERETA